MNIVAAGETRGQRIATDRHPHPIDQNGLEVDLRIVFLGCLIFLVQHSTGYGQTRGRQMFLEGRDLLRKVTSFECRGEYLPPITTPHGWTEVRMVYNGGSYRTEESYLNSRGKREIQTRTFDGRRYQSHTKSDYENVLGNRTSPPESFRHQVPSPFDLAYGWTKQPFSQFKADPKLWATAEQMMDEGDETINGIRCLKVNRQDVGIRQDDGITISKWLSYEHQGMPVKTLVTDSKGTVLKRVDVTEFMTVDVEGASLLFPLHITGWLQRPYELMIDRDSVRVNQPILESEFEISTVGVEEIFDHDTGVWTNLVTGRLYDRNMIQIVSTPAPLVVPVPEKPVRIWLILLNTSMAVALGLFLLRNRLWAGKTPD